MRIESYRFGRIVIGDTLYTQDVIICPDHIAPNWWRKEGHLLQLDDLNGVLKESPDVLIIGTGAYGLMRVPDELSKTLKSMNIEVIVAQTKEACDTYNKLHSEKQVAAALHLTC